MITQESILRDAARVIVWYPFRWFLSLLSLKTGFALMRSLGNIHWLLSPGKRKLVERNMGEAEALAGGGRAIPAAARRYLQTHYINQLLIFFFPRFNPDSLSRIHRFEGLAVLDETLARNRGVVLVHPHFGPVHLPLFHLGLLGYPVNQLGALRKPAGLSRIGEKVSFRLRDRYERMIPARIIPRGVFLRPVFQHLGDNGVLLITGDGAGRGDFFGAHAEFPFLGRKMLFPLGPARLAGKTGASLLALFTTEEDGEGRYLTRIESLGRTGDGPDPEAATASFVERFEEHLGRNPHLWHFWDEFVPGGLLAESGEN